MIQKTKKGSSSLEPAQIRLQKAREKFGSLISPERLEEFKTRVNNSGLCEIISDTVWGEDTLKFFLSISGIATDGGQQWEDCQLKRFSVKPFAYVWDKPK